MWKLVFLLLLEDLLWNVFFRIPSFLYFWHSVMLWVACMPPCSLQRMQCFLVCAFFEKWSVVECKPFCLPFFSFSHLFSLWGLWNFLQDWLCNGMHDYWYKLLLNQCQLCRRQECLMLIQHLLDREALVKKLNTLQPARAAGRCGCQCCF